MRKTGQEIERVRQARVSELKREILSKLGKGNKEVVSVLHDFSEGVVEAMFIGSNVIRISSPSGFKDFSLKETETRINHMETHELHDLCEHIVNIMIFDYVNELSKQTRISYYH